MTSSERSHRHKKAPLVVLATAGTLGDLWPVLALGKTLLQRGVRVRLSAPWSFHSHASKLGMETCDCRPAVDMEHVQRFASSWDHWEKVKTERLHWGRPKALDLSARYHDLMTAAEGADVFISSSTQFLGNLVHEKTGIPSMTLAIAPPYAARCTETQKALKPLDDDGAKKIFHAVDGEPLVHILDHIREFRGSIGLPEEPDGPFFGNAPVIGAISRHFCEPDREKFPNIEFTGFWYHERPEWFDWQPDPLLERFIEKGDPPLVLTFSSLPLCNAASVLKVHARAAMLLQRRLVILSGWAGFQKNDIPAECIEHVFVTGELPHEWLFKRSAAVIQHGGIGTLAQTVRSGKPMLIEPYGNDQFFNAGRAVKLGIGAAAHPHWTTPEALAGLLENKVLCAAMSQRVQTLADTMLTDPGVEYAADLVMARL
ncbi:MAG: glycosyltransferase [Chlorobium sp.]|jgi:UDP:flavonoid glycosyltransferase YjiC (YdhE family)|nr:MAG: hypothetical protein FDX12_03465 [Chlorobium sp.]